MNSRACQKPELLRDILVPYGIILSAHLTLIGWQNVDPTCHFLLQWWQLIQFPDLTPPSPIWFIVSGVLSEMSLGTSIFPWD